MLHPCKHCAQHHANGSPAFSLPPRQRQYEQQNPLSPPSIAPNTSRKKDRPSSPTMLPSSSNGSGSTADNCHQHTDHLAIGDHNHHQHQQHHHRIIAADSSSNQFTCRWLDAGHRCGQTDALDVQSVNRTEHPNISISGQRRRPISDSDGNRCPSIPRRQTDMVITTFIHFYNIAKCYPRPQMDNKTIRWRPWLTFCNNIIIPQLHTPPTTCIQRVPFDQRSANVPAHSSNQSMPLSSSSPSSPSPSSPSPPSGQTPLNHSNEGDDGGPYANVMHSASDVTDSASTVITDKTDFSAHPLRKRTPTMLRYLSCVLRFCQLFCRLVNVLPVEWVGEMRDEVHYWRNGCIREVQNSDSQVRLPFDKCDRNTGEVVSRPAKRAASATTASVAAFSHVLLFCAVFAVFGMGRIGSGGGSMVHASDPLRNSTSNIPKFSQESGSE